MGKGEGGEEAYIGYGRRSGEDDSRADGEDEAEES